MFMFDLNLTWEYIIVHAAHEILMHFQSSRKVIWVGHPWYRRIIIILTKSIRCQNKTNLCLTWRDRTVQSSRISGHMAIGVTGDVNKLVHTVERMGDERSCVSLSMVCACYCRKHLFTSRIWFVYRPFVTSKLRDQGSYKCPTRVMEALCNLHHPKNG